MAKLDHKYTSPIIDPIDTQPEVQAVSTFAPSQIDVAQRLESVELVGLSAPNATLLA